MHHILFAAVLALTLAAPLPAAFSVESSSAALEGGDEDSRQQDAYEKGTDALDDGKWEKAVSAFTTAAGLPGDRTDGALYWKAYAQNKLGRRADALATLEDFKRRFSNSRWAKDARSLEAEVRQAAGRPGNPEAESDEDLKLIAINGLLSSDPEQAVPLLEKFLAGNSSPKLKERALFVLAQSGSPRARDIVGGIARGQANPDLQEKAIKYLGLFGGEKTRQILSEIYAGSSDAAVKERILHSFMTSGDRARVLEAARAEKNSRLRAAAVHELGVMGARTELWQLYQTETAKDVKEGIIHGLFIAGDAEHITELARTEKDPGLRGEAIHRCGLFGQDRTGAGLVALYKNERDADLKEKAIHALFVQNNAAGLVDLAKAEKNRELKAAIVQKLSLMKSKEATEYLMEILNK
jgi:HEAT repeat protein